MWVFAAKLFARRVAKEPSVAPQYAGEIVFGEAMASKELGVIYLLILGAKLPQNFPNHRVDEKRVSAIFLKNRKEKDLQK